MSHFYDDDFEPRQPELTPVDPLADSSWRVRGEEVPASDIHADAPLPSEAAAMFQFSVGHTVGMTEGGVQPLVVLTLGLEGADGVERHETVVFPPEAARVVAATLLGTLQRMGEPTVRDLLRVDL